MVSRFVSLLRDSRGSMAVEFSIWLPFICILLVIVIDASYLYLGQNQMWAVARDVARRMTTNVLPDASAAESWAVDYLSKYEIDYEVQAEKQTDYVSVIIMAPVSQVVPFGLFQKAFMDKDIVARVVIRRA